MLINNATYQRETLSERPIRQPLNPGGGHWPRKGVWGCAAVMTPFFQASRRSLAYQFTIIAPLLCLHFQILEKNSIFRLVLVKISALKTQIFQIFVP